MQCESPTAPDSPRRPPVRRNAAERLLEYQRQVSTGKRVERPATIPSAAAPVDPRARHAQAAIGRYLDATDSARSRACSPPTPCFRDLIQQLSASQVTILQRRGTSAHRRSAKRGRRISKQLRDAVLPRSQHRVSRRPTSSAAPGTTPPYRRTTSASSRHIRARPSKSPSTSSKEHEVAVVFNGESARKRHRCRRCLRRLRPGDCRGPRGRRNAR